MSCCWHVGTFWCGSFHFAEETLFGWVQKPDGLGSRPFDQSTVDFRCQRDVLTCPSFDFPFSKRLDCGGWPAPLR